MSLYLAIFDDDDEVDGWVLGRYSDFGYFRDVVARYFTIDQLPTLLGHSDCDGEWSSSELPSLRHELLAVAERFRQLPPEPVVDAFDHTERFRHDTHCLADCFHNIDGERLIDALLALVDHAESLDLPILFQ